MSKVTGNSSFRGVMPTRAATADFKPRVRQMSLILGRKLQNTPCKVDNNTSDLRSPIRSVEIRDYTASLR